jgi:hypothetical protein
MYLSKLVGKGISEQFNSNFSLSLKGENLNLKKLPLKVLTIFYVNLFYNLYRNSFNE